MRRATVLITADLIEAILTPGLPTVLAKPARCERGLPVGARLVGAHVNDRRELALVFEHAEFSEQADGTEPPVMQSPVFRQEA